MCACNKPEPRRTRTLPPPGVRSATIVTSNPGRAFTPATPQPVQAMDADRVRIEQLRRESIRRTFGH